MKYVGNLSTTEKVLADGSVIEPGREFNLSKEAESDPHNARLIREGQIQAVNQKKEDS